MMHDVDDGNHMHNVSAMKQSLNHRRQVSIKAAVSDFS